jgi:DNA polymerase
MIARPGCRFFSADFSAIQAVVTSCLANERWRIDVFKGHGKIYEMMAALLTGKEFKYYLDYKKEFGKHHEDRQNYGKIPVLSADFGAWVNGWKQFGADKLGDDEYIKQLILKTRATIPNIVEFWGGQTRNKFGRDPATGARAKEYAQLYGLEGAAISAILEPGNCFGYRGVSYQVVDDVMYCCPPSGGLITYHKPRLEPSSNVHASPWELEITYEGWNTNQKKGRPGWLRMKLYGGVLTQNVVSHESREIQALALVRLEKHGYPVVMHTHDENVVEVPEGTGSKEEYIQLVRQLPPWAMLDDGTPWPIKVPDAWEAQRYGKWEE